MFTKKITDLFTTDLLNAVSGVLGEAKKCKDCGCAKCTCDTEEDDAEETQEGYIPTTRNLTARDNETIGKLSALMKKEREAKEKKEPLGVKTEETEVEENYVSHAQRKAVWANRADDGKGHPDKKKKMKEEAEDLDEAGLWANIHAKRERIKRGSGERMRKPGEKGAPTPEGLKSAQEEVQVDEVAPPGAKYERMVKHIKKAYAKDGKLTDKEKGIAYATAWKAKNEETEIEENWVVKKGTEVVSTHKSKDEADVKAMKHPLYKVVAKEEVEIEEAVGDITVKKLSPDEAFKKHTGQMTKKTSVPKDPKTGKTLYQKMTSEEAEELDEVSKATLGRYINKAKDQVDAASWRSGYRAAKPNDPNSQAIINAKEKQLSKRHKGIETAVSKLTKEEAEQIDELSKDTLKSYMDKKKVPSGTVVANTNDKDSMRKYTNRVVGGVRAAKRLMAKEEAEQIDEISRGMLSRYQAASKEEGRKNRLSPSGASSKVTKRTQGADLAMRKSLSAVTGKKLAKVAATNEEVEQIDEISREALGSYVVNAAKDAKKHGVVAGLKIKSGEDSSKEFKKMKNREKGIDTAVSRLTQEEQEFIDSLNTMDLDEARGRPKKNAGKDFTVNPRTKEKLYHDNPEHMAKIERLQKNGVIAKPKTEASQHIINQLSKAKTSMRGGETIHFTHGESQHVSGTHAARLLDKYHGMKPDEKEAFQKKIGHSHAKLKSEL